MKDYKGNSFKAGDILGLDGQRKIKCISIEDEVAEFVSLRNLQESFKLDQKSMLKSRWVYSTHHQKKHIDLMELERKLEELRQETESIQSRLSELNID